MRRLIGLAVLLYPRVWRRRYGAEYAALLTDVEPRFSVLVDVVRGALRARLTQRAVPAAALGDAPMATLATPGRRASRYGLGALVLALPTAILVILSVLKYVLGVPEPFDVLEPSLTPLVTHPLGESLVILAPYMALLLAGLPVTRLRLGRSEGHLHFGIEIDAPLANLVAVFASVSLIAVMLVYYLMENF